MHFFALGVAFIYRFYVNTEICHLFRSYIDVFDQLQIQMHVMLRLHPS